IGTVFQSPEHQFVAATVRDELLVGPRASRRSTPRRRTPRRSTPRRSTPRPEEADELLEVLGLTSLADANPFTLSGGQQRRLSVGTA
ncbi:hypothetical protein ACOI9R_39145, partial [Mesorhizobium japonicum]